MIQYISHEYLPDDQYTKEICYLSVDSKFRFAYVRKQKKDGGMYWSPISAGVTVNGEKKYRDAIQWDSNFLQKDILAFLDARSWEDRSVAPNPATAVAKPAQYEQTSFVEECPF